ncbi:macro domain-containing protein [Streptomyces mirabilis]|uniref:macro domain-containing protein n=1 Tax=Streptomyces mirabilis TaxID=68239 RepID=UPI0036B8E5A1
MGPITDPGRNPVIRRRWPYRSCLDLACDVETIRTLAFCGVSAGVFGYPKDEAARVALRTVAEWLDPGRFDRVVPPCSKPTTRPTGTS